MFEVGGCVSPRQLGPPPGGFVRPAPCIIEFNEEPGRIDGQGVGLTVSEFVAFILLDGQWLSFGELPLADQALDEPLEWWECTLVLVAQDLADAGQGLSQQALGLLVVATGGAADPARWSAVYDSHAR